MSTAISPHSVESAGAPLSKVANRGDLVAVGDTAGRAVVLEVVDRALTQLDSYHRILGITRFADGILTIGERSWNLNQKRNVYLVGAGKACNAMAMAIDHVLGDRLTAGIAIVKIAEDTDKFHRTQVVIGGHPLPNEAGYAATRQILDLVDGSGPDDLFIAVVSGGSSSLMNCPVEGISIADEAAATDLLLKTGAGIFEVNAVRRHISQVNGGRLAERIAASGAELIGVGISDAVSRPRTGDVGIPVTDYNSTPIGPDPTTLADALRVLVDHDLREVMPPSVVNFLENAGPEAETPTAFPQHTYFLVNTLPDAAEAARQAATDMGIEAHVLTTFLAGESRDAGTVFASIARQLSTTGGPFQTPCVIVTSGETTTRIGPSDAIRGTGGPSHELTAGFALAAAAAHGSVMLSIDSEGTDGTTLAAGGMCDSSTLARAHAAGIDLVAALRNHGTHEALAAIGDAVFTGNTGTNLCDLNVLYVPGPGAFDE